MAAYVIVDSIVTDPAAYEEYKRLAGVSVAAHGGRFLARGGAAEVLEGDVTPHRTVITEFPSMEAARRWYDSPEYLAARKAREGAATMTMVLVEGA
ncbi:MAG: DUF1330 domain-containing protein [Rhodospirillales bacterium]|nr:DUF1330 domain-containing protein [Rhodospirillales bacterium]